MKAHLRIAVLIAVAILLLALFLRQANFGDVWAEIRDGRLDLVLLAIAVTMLTYALRAFRWQYLLRALGPTHFSTAFRTTVIGFAVNFLLPARVGEIVRPYLLARDEGLNATSAFATIILERLLDMVTVLVLFAVFLLLFDVRQSPVDPRWFRDIRMAGFTAGVGALLALAVVFVLAGHPDAAARIALRIERVLPARMAHAFSRLVRMFVTGLGVVRQPSRLAMTFLLSFPLWLSIATGIFLVTRAFHVDMPFTGAFVVMTLLVVGVAIPTPGAIGGFDYFYQVAVTAFYGVPRNRAIGAALVLHAISFLPVTLVGIIFMAREGLSLGRMRGLAKLAGEQEQEGTP
jgi:uncharacterized protein (TIRG00374 family)